jgi:hypothetical protein
MSIQAPNVQCGDQSIHLPHMHWFNDGIGTPGFNPDRWGSYDRASCPGVTEESRNADATKAVLEKQADAIRVKLDERSALEKIQTWPGKTAPASDYSWGEWAKQNWLGDDFYMAMNVFAAAAKHSAETAHITNLVIRPVTKGYMFVWRCDFCLAGDE